MELPADLPVPIDDGAARHLLGMVLPGIALESTAGDCVRLDDADRLGKRAVIFFYPRTGVPGQPPSLGFSGEEWDSIPGARGCTPQSCGFRDLHERFLEHGVRVWGLSTNTIGHQREFKARTHIPFEFLSDSGLELVKELRLPTFAFPVESGGPTMLIHRMVWYVEPDARGRLAIPRVWYPVFPPDRCAAVVLEWLEGSRPTAGR